MLVDKHRFRLSAGALTQFILGAGSLMFGVNSWAAESGPSDDFAKSIRPVLESHCAACHAPDDPKNKAPFLKASTADDVADNRGLWAKVAAQLRNRAMPPAGPQPSEEDRFRIATWIEQQLRSAACRVGDFAGAVTARRLNRREYSNTIRDLAGVELPFFETFPADGSGGEGFDNNGETLFFPRS